MSAIPSASAPANNAWDNNAWDDDWEKQADTLPANPTPPQQPPPAEKKVSSKVTKAQRRAQQAEFNRQLWAEAESPQTFHFLEAKSDVPLKQEFKPTVTVLSRHPQPPRQSSAVDSTASGVGRMGINDDDDDSEDEKPPEPTPEERQAIALKNLEEKQKKYEEVRERLFGSPSATTSGASSPRSGTPPKQFEGRGKGRGRGSGRNNNGEKRDSSSASGKSKHLYDPGSPARSNSGSNPGFGHRKQGGDRNGGEQSNRPYRNPRGPDSSGRGGFRGNRGARGS